MEKKPRKFRFGPKLESLEVYLLAADNPIGKRQFRPIFRRKRSKEVLTREQVVAIKRGRRVLRRELKEQGIKRWSDFDTVATSLGLYFDRKGLLWPFFLWLMKGNTAVKVLATVAALTTLMTVIQPMIEYLTQYLTQYLTEYLTEWLTDYVDRDRDGLTISLSDEMWNTGFELSETPDFADPKEVLFSVPAWNIPCVSISQIPHNVDELPVDHTTEYFTYTFYCRYINKDAERDMTGDLSQYAANYDWGLRIGKEGFNTTTNSDNRPPLDAPTTKNGLMVSDAVWVMVIQDGEVILSAKGNVDEGGNINIPMLPTQEVLETKKIAFVDRSIDYINTGLARIHPNLNADNVGKLETLFATQAEIDTIQAQVDAYFDREGIQDLTRLMLKTDNWEEHYKIVGTRENYNYYQVIAEPFVSDEIVAERTRTGMLPWIDDRNEEYHKYTVVIWLEGDDPECRNDLMDGFISLNFQIKGEGDDYMMGPIYGETVPATTPPAT